MKWRTSTWTRLIGECLWIPLFKQQFILVKTMLRVYDTWRIISWVSLKKLFKETEKLVDQGPDGDYWCTIWFITKSTHGARQACCVTQFIRSRTPRLTSSPTRCSLGGIEQTRTKFGKKTLSGILRLNHLRDLNRIDGDSMEIEWNILPGFTKFGFLEQIHELMKQ